MKVLSLYDGISCGHVALDKAGIPVERYVAYEIEKNAIKIALKNYPDTEEMGDVFQGVFSDYKGFDMVIGGSPCTYWSIAQKPGKRETENSGIGWELFNQYVRALRESEAPYFLYENNYSMDKKIKTEITKAFNAVMEERREKFPKDSEQYKAANNYESLHPIYINSSLVSAQSRSRLYWTNIPNFVMPRDEGIKLQDILEYGYADREKSLCITRRYAGFGPCVSESGQARRYFGKSFGQAVFASKEARDEVYLQWKENPYFDKVVKGVPYEKDPKKRRIRQLTVTEVERCQTLPDGYTDLGGTLSDSKRIESIGNGWTVGVIVNFFKQFKNTGPKKFIFGV